MVAGELDLHNREQVPVPGDCDHAGDHDKQVSVLGDNGGDDDFGSDMTLRDAIPREKCSFFEHCSKGL